MMPISGKSLLVLALAILACSRAPEFSATKAAPPPADSAAGPTDPFGEPSKLIVRVGTDMILHVKTADGKVVGDAAADDGGAYFRQLRQRRGDVPVALATESDVPQAKADELFEELRSAGFTRLERPVVP